MLMGLAMSGMRAALASAGRHCFQHVRAPARFGARPLGAAWGITSSRLVILWNEQTHRWTVGTEPVKLKVGASSADIRLDRIINVQGGGVKR
jgi:hypothetical protein